MSKFSIGDKVQIRVKFDCLYNGVTATVGSIVSTETGNNYYLDLDVGGRIIASDEQIVAPGTPGGTYTYQERWEYP